MLITCPECELQVSDKAAACPHCGYPMKQDVVRRKNKKAHRRLPNGFGQITKLSNTNLRKPFRVMVTVSKNEFGKPVCKLLKPEAYFETYNEAYAALIEYNKCPYDLDPGITVGELYNEWSKKYFEQLTSDSSIRTITSAWAYCSSVRSMRVKDLRVKHIKGCMEDGEAILNGVSKKPSNVTKSKIKSLFNLMLDYALEQELIDKNYARSFKIEKDLVKVDKKHLSFTEEEMSILWKHKNDPIVNIILIQCYMGWRPQEIGLIKKKDVDFEHWTITGGMKTEAGTNREVPICEKIKEAVKFAYEASQSEYLFEYPDHTMLTYDKYRYRFKEVISSLGLNEKHRAHDPRKQFVTMCKNAGVDEYAIKKMCGHAISDITEKVYTDRNSDWLRAEIEKI